MPVHERRQHFRIDDQVYFDYKILQPGSLCSDKSLTEELLGQSGQRFLETTQYFQTIDYELAELTQALALKEPALTHYLNLINAKIDYLARHLLMGDKIHLRKVNISLGGMAFKTKERIKEKTLLKLVIYTKPKMVPIVVDAVCVYSQYLSEDLYRTAVQFDALLPEQEQLLSQHIMLAQVKCRAD
ncbi:type IV pilus assembly PilZ [Legionella quinlivanii]|uniref:Type IV pilus assembly PilZ n=1 Tax=Legionella quinlivanii TaxID=45073 RepID=A0A0W0XNX5_9GAMM|nr:PilZ domain-containing protein [Legionella quinlivanii]KTD46083.1 type IV pilus assembly PilZ [Legionella quinlivanii]MCW8451227.1 PilZ domain-containing protein [Legionella quinlivanii]SEG29031.1 PilZ domain-containing protein [Legionella quinlivanii DSM 21216]STY10580.1 type IV pilus assembly PilZ [Legionella quinlivanii]